MKQYKRISDIQSDLNNGLVTCVDLVEHYLHNIQAKTDLNAFLEVWDEEARTKAITIDEKIAKKAAGKLAGVVIALKDNLAYKNHKVGCASKILDGFESLYSATVVQRLEQEDAIFIGRTNCDEFAMGASNENSAFGPVKNAIDPSRVPGGSSGGSAVAVAADMCHCALGSDTGGSIRQPAAFNGIYGFKPTYGLVSRWGLLAYASSFDQIGPMTKSLEDIAFITQIIAGVDANDASMLQQPAPIYTEFKATSKITFSVMNEALFNEGLDPQIKQHFETLINTLLDQGHKVKYFDFPLLEHLVPTYYVLTTAEASSNLSRYSGMLYGHRSKKGSDLESTITLSRSEGFGPEVKRRILLGTFVLSSDHYDAYYEKAQKVRRKILDETNIILESSDVILLPTTSTPAFKLGEKSKDPIAMYLADLFTVQANLSGNPAISIPLFNNDKNLPIGVQLMTKHQNEQELFNIAHLLENISTQ